MNWESLTSGIAIIAVGAFATAYLGDKFLDYAQKPRRAGGSQRDGQFYYLQYDENGNINKVSSNNPYNW